MILIVPHQLPPLSMGGCEDLALSLAGLLDAAVFCPRELNEREPGFRGRVQLDKVAEVRNVPLERIYFLPDIDRVPWDRVEQILVVGLEYPHVLARLMRHLHLQRKRYPIDVIPLFHSRARHMGSKLRSLPPDLHFRTMIVFSHAEEMAIRSRLSSARSIILPHLPGLCARYLDGRNLPPPDRYLLFPSRDIKGIEKAIALARRLKLRLAVNTSYNHPALPPGALQLDFDIVNPFQRRGIGGCVAVCNFGPCDSYNISNARAVMHGAVPIYDPANVQVTEIWKRCPTALPYPEVDSFAAITEEQRKNARIWLEREISGALEGLKRVLATSPASVLPGAPERRSQVAVVVPAYNRPGYLEKTLKSIVEARRQQDCPVLLFLDWAGREMTYRMETLARKIVPDIIVKRASRRKGCALALIWAREEAFFRLNYDEIILVEEDIILGPTAIEFLLRARDQFSASDIGCIQAWSRCPWSAAEKRRAVDKVIITTQHFGAYWLPRWAYENIRPYFQMYLPLVQKMPPDRRNHAVLRSFLRRVIAQRTVLPSKLPRAEEIRRLLTSARAPTGQDAILLLGLYAEGLKRLAPVVNRALNVGQRGSNLTPDRWNPLGFGKVRLDPVREPSRYQLVENVYPWT